MAILYTEIAYAACLLQSHKTAVLRGELEGRISSKAQKDIKDFQRKFKNALQAMNYIQDLYIKSFFYNTCRNYLTLYARVKGQDTPIICQHVGTKKGEGKNKRRNIGAYAIHAEKCAISYRMRNMLAAMLDYYIPSENSLFNHAAINFMPNWRAQ